MDKMLKSSELGTRALVHLGKAGMQGVLQQAIGGIQGWLDQQPAGQQIKEQLPELGSPRPAPSSC